MIINIIVSQEKGPLMDMNEAAAFLRLCVPIFKKLVKAGDIPFVQYPGIKKKLYRREDLEKFIDDNKIKPIKFDIDDIPVVNSLKKPNKTIKKSNNRIPKSVIQQWVREIN